MKPILAPVLLALLVTQAQAQFKCTAPDGSVTFQQAPCATAAKSEALKIAKSDRAPRPPNRGTGEEIRVGMRLIDVVHALGDASPRAINDFESAGGKRSQWIYERDGYTLYVYMDGNFNVTGVQKFQN